MSTHNPNQPYRYVDEWVACFSTNMLHSSERNPVPTIQGYEADRKKNANGNSNGDAKKNADAKGKAEKQAIMNRAQGPKQKPTDAVENERKKGDRMVKDPVTGMDVLIKDANLEGMYFGFTT